jgi:hypothetical protein
MSPEKQESEQAEHKVPTEVEKKIHQTHFSALKIPLQDGDHDSTYEWVSSGVGRLKLVLIKLKEEIMNK